MAIRTNQPETAASPGNIQPAAIADTAVQAARAAEFGLLRLTPPTPPPDNPFTGKLPAFPDADDPDGWSLLNTPVYGRVILGGTDEPLNRYTDAQGREQSYYTLTLDCALVSVDFNPQVVVTNIQGLHYSIKEFISSGDVTITIDGGFYGTPGSSPVDFIINMARIMNAGTPIPVTNSYLNNIGITHIVCMPGCRMWQEEGGYSYQKFVLVALSDVPMTDMLP